MFEAAVRNPDSLARVVDPDVDEYECECYPGMDAWFATTRTERDDAGYTAWGAAYRAKYPTPPRLLRSVAGGTTTTMSRCANGTAVRAVGRFYNDDAHRRDE